MPRAKNRESVNPPHNRRLPPEPPEAIKARLFDYHKRAGSLGTYYDLYPEDRPIERELPPRGRGR